MKLTLHTCEITRARDTLRDLSDNALRGRMVALQIKGEDAKVAVAQGGWGEDYRHASNKGLATYATRPATVLKMCRRDWALANFILNERLA